MKFTTGEQEKQMLADCDRVEAWFATHAATDYDDFDLGGAADVCCHVKALLAEIKLLRETVDVVQEQRVDAAVEGSDWKAKALKMYSEYGETPEQYHNGISKLWKALGITSVQEVDVFTQAAKKIVDYRDTLYAITTAATGTDEIDQQKQIFDECGTMPSDYFLEMRSKAARMQEQIHNYKKVDRRRNVVRCRRCQGFAMNLCDGDHECKCCVEGESDADE